MWADQRGQRARGEGLNASDEGELRGFSEGCRPGRSPHDALDAVTRGSWRYHLWMSSLTVLMLLGAYAYSIQLERGLIVTGGSDFHGPGHHRAAKLGRVGPPRDQFEKLVERIGAVQATVQTDQAPAE